MKEIHALQQCLVEIVFAIFENLPRIGFSNPIRSGLRYEEENIGEDEKEVKIFPVGWPKESFVSVHVKKVENLYGRSWQVSTGSVTAQHLHLWGDFKVLRRDQEEKLVIEFTKLRKF